MEVGDEFFDEDKLIVRDGYLKTAEIGDEFFEEEKFVIRDDYSKHLEVNDELFGEGEEYNELIEEKEKVQLFIKDAVCKRHSSNKQTDKCSISHLFEGQSFPFRLWHLIHNDNFDDVIHWSPDGNCVVFPDEKEFVAMVLKLDRERIFKTESMKSFVRQLNLYGFHKVQLEKDETFVHLLRHREKQNWPDAVFEHPFFKRGRSDLLERVKRRCKVKQSKAAHDKLNTKMAGNDVFGGFNMAPNNLYESRVKNVQYIQCPPQYVGLQTDQAVPQYPNVIPPMMDYSIDRRQMKRRFDFGDVKEEKKRPPPQQVPQYPPPPPFYAYPQTIINNNYQAMVHPPGWAPVAPPNITHGGPYMGPCNDNVNYFYGNLPHANYQRKVMNPYLNGNIAGVEDDSPENYLTHDSNYGAKSVNNMAPMTAFCAAPLFSPLSQQLFPGSAVLPGGGCDYMIDRPELHKQ